MLASHTEDATMDIDAEIPADRQQLKDLIRHEARAMAKKMIDSAVEEKLKSMQMPVSKTRGGASKDLAPRQK
jgi:beta-lactamase regulating signal transducer with metallopeptidase domain